MRNKRVLVSICCFFICVTNVKALSATESANWQSKLRRLYKTSRGSYTTYYYDEVMKMVDEYETFSDEDQDLLGAVNRELLLELAASYKMIRAIDEKDYILLDGFLKQYQETFFTVSNELAKSLEVMNPNIREEPWFKEFRAYRDVYFERLSKEPLKDSPMQHAIDNYDTEAIDILLDNNFNARYFNSERGPGGQGLPCSWLNYCIQTGNIEMLRYLSRKGLTLDCYSGEFPENDAGILYAIHKGCSDEMLLSVWEIDDCKGTMYRSVEEYSVLNYPLLYWVASRDNAIHVMQLLNLEYQAALLIEYRYSYPDSPAGCSYYTVYEKLNPVLQDLIPVEYRKTFSEVFADMNEEEKQQILTQLSE